MYFKDSQSTLRLGLQIIAFFSLSTHGMKQETHSYVMNPLELIDDINSYHECNIDGITTFRNAIPYYKKHAAMNAVLHVIFAIQPFIKQCFRFQKTPFNKALLKLFFAFNSHKTSRISLELPRYNYLEFMKLCETNDQDNSCNKIFSFIRDCIYTDFNGIIIDLDFVIACHETTYCTLCKKNEFKLLLGSSFSINNKMQKNVETHISSYFSQKEIFDDKFCQCFHNIQSKTLLKAPLVFTIINNTEEAVKSLCFGLKPLDLSPYLMNKDRACLYNLKAVLLTNFDPQEPIFAALVSEKNRGWVLYLQHYEHVINQNSFNQFAARGSCRIRLIKNDSEKKEHELYPARLLYVQQNV